MNTQNQPEAAALGQAMQITQTTQAAQAMQAVNEAIANGQWHTAWRGVLDAAMPLPAPSQRVVLQALDAWDAGGDAEGVERGDHGHQGNQGNQGHQGHQGDGAQTQRHALLREVWQHLVQAHQAAASRERDWTAADALAQPEQAHYVLAQGLCKSYGKRAGGFQLGPVDVQVAPGQILGLVGENGNGKTTLLRMLAADLQADAGSLDWGCDASDVHRLRSQLVYIPQRPPKWGGRLLDHLAFAARSHGVTGERLDTLVQLVIARLGLRAFRGHQWKQLSSGYKMRFELARALLCAPRVLLLDEPLANLDINAQQTLLTDLRDMARSPWQPMAMLLSSQQLYEVEKIADQVLFLQQGQPRQVADRFAQMAGCAIEFESPLSAPELAAKLADLPAHELAMSGETRIISFHTAFDASAFLRHAVQVELPLSYFRDITHSTRRLFVR
jgi:ABC-2 type transport system ATP-binding protein